MEMSDCNARNIPGQKLVEQHLYYSKLAVYLNETLDTNILFEMLK